MTNGPECPSQRNVRVKMKIVLIRDGHTKKPGLTLKKLRQSVLELYPVEIRDDPGCQSQIRLHILANREAGRGFKKEGATMTWYKADEDDDVDC
jgi:hypothetical protein